MDKFKLSDLGEQFRLGLSKLSTGAQSISWSLDNYNLKSNTITGDINLVLDESESAPFNRMHTVLLLDQLKVEMKGMTYTPGHLVDHLTSNIVLRTSISLEDFPEIALSNYIKDAQETLNYEWNI